MASVGALSFKASKVDSSLDQLFSSSLNSGVLQSRAKEPPRKKVKVVEVTEKVTSPEDSSEASEDELSSRSDLDDAADIEELAREEGLLQSSDEDEEAENDQDSDEGVALADREDIAVTSPDTTVRRKRKRASNGVEIEDVYMAKLEREHEAERRRLKNDAAMDDPGADGTSSEGESDDSADSEDEAYTVPKHETQDASGQDVEFEKAARTVFLGNVSSEAIRSKEALRELKAHLTSFFPQLPENGDKATHHRLESFRFRSVAFSTTSIPRKAAFAKKEVMDATTKSTNAYAVYSTNQAAREAVKRLNGTIVLERHLRVDGVAHPSAVDHRRCVFVGNLGFVDDESIIRANGEDDDDDDDSEKPKKKKKNKVKQPADIEEGLWRTFATVGTVESVRVVRDKTTRVGKGIAYVQFTDQVAVEKALTLDGKTFPPLLPRTLRVTRAKKPSKTNSAVERRKDQAIAAMRNAKAAAGRTYNPKVDTQARTASGRAAKLFGRAGAAQQARKGRGGKPTDAGNQSKSTASSIKPPESFVFEGHRATLSDGKGKINMKPIRSNATIAKKKKGGKPTSRSSRRGAAFKSAKRKV